jgi:hypothetical protein
MLGLAFRAGRLVELAIGLVYVALFIFAGAIALLAFCTAGL